MVNVISKQRDTHEIIQESYLIIHDYNFSAYTNYNISRPGNAFAKEEANA